MLIYDLSFLLKGIFIREKGITMSTDTIIVQIALLFTVSDFRENDGLNRVHTNPDLIIIYYIQNTFAENLQWFKYPTT